MPRSWLLLLITLAPVWPGCSSGREGAVPTGSASRPARVNLTTQRSLPLNSEANRSAAPTVAPNALDATQALSAVRAERDLYWLNARKEVYRSLPELIAQHRAELDRDLRFTRLLHGDPARREIALTFDDGPHPAITPRLLAVLRAEQVPATFFVVGYLAEKHPDLIRAEVAGGHVVGNHTYDHVSLVKIPDSYVATEIKACDEVITGITGRRPRYFRPPGGEYDPRVAEAAEALGYTMVLWTDDPGDYASPGASVIRARTLAHVRAGGIILLHDGIPETLDVLQDLIQTLKAQGFRFVTVDAMARAARDRQTS